MPLLLSLALFCYLAICGRALFCLLGIRVGRERTWLLSPALGFAVVVLLVMILNQTGIRIAAFGRPLVILTFAGALAVLVRARAIPRRTLLPFAGLAGVGLLLGGWPALVHGWNWVSYGNDDMTNYCLSAERFLRHGFFDIPSPADLDGGDYSQIYWLLNVASLERFSSQLLIATVAATTGLKTVQIFMPVIIGVALAQLWAFIGLAYSAAKHRKLALIAGAIIATAPLWHYGTTYQLIAQVAGLTLLAAVSALTTRNHFPRRLAGRLKFALLVAILLAALCVTYPEVLPFFIIGWGGCFVLRLWAVRRWPAGAIPSVLFAAGFTFLLLRANILSAFFTLLGQTQSGLDVTVVTNRIALFPYFLMPAGASFFFGFNVIAWRYPEALATSTLVAGFVAAAVLLFAWWRGMRQRSVAAMILLGMAGIGVILFRANNGFGVFKLAMFALPFAAIELARLAELPRWRPAGRVLFAALLAVWITGSLRYTGASLGGNSRAVNELFNASESRGRLPGNPPAVWSDMASSPVGKLFMLERPEVHATFLSQIFGARFLGIATKPYPDWAYRLLPGDISTATALGLVNHIQHGVYQPRRAFGLDFWSPARGEIPAAADTVLITSIAEFRSFNKLSAVAAPAGLFDYRPLADVTNHLVFTQSKQGQHYYLGDVGSIAIYKPELDLYSGGNYFFAAGRHLLFRVLNPTGPIRLRFSLTSSLLGEGRTQLPVRATANDGRATPHSLGLVGAGSANIFSEPLQPLVLDGVSYVALDLGVDPLPLGRPATGLAGVYHRNLSFDTRLALAYCRDISVVDEAQYLAQPRKRRLDHFPADLVGPAAAEYSGLYEDGWLSDHAFVVLGPSVAGEVAVVSGMFPRLAGAAESQGVEVWLDGVFVSRQEIAPGDFTLVVPVTAARPALRIELRFAHTLPLPSPDNRPVSVLLKSIQLQSAP
jgi:hypothetical protein